jgi:predicted transcriptional regulator
MLREHMATRSAANEPQQSVHTTIRMPFEMYEALADLAKVNERHVSAEIRLAVRHWVTPEVVRDRNGGK